MEARSQAASCAARCMVRPLFLGPLGAWNRKGQAAQLKSAGHSPDSFTAFRLALGSAASLGAAAQMRVLLQKRRLYDPSQGLDGQLLGSDTGYGAVGKHKQVNRPGSRRNVTRHHGEAEHASRSGVEVLDA